MMEQSVTALAISGLFPLFAIVHGSPVCHHAGRSTPQRRIVPNPGQPTISPGATGEVVRRLQRALRRTPNLGLTVNGTFDPQTETAVKQFQESAGLVVDGIVGPIDLECIAGRRSDADSARGFFR
jgi:peptidoglycan hydrolase-like protein with peptidoglycan-binding domain